MKVLVVGGGGREHVLAWKIAQSPKVEEVFCAPGNAGIAKIATCLDCGDSDIEGLVKLAREHEIDLTVVGPEAPLAAGIVDSFNKAGLRIFGPDKSAARLEGSKAFTKNLMKKYDIPTAGYEIFDKLEDAVRYVKETPPPLVIKADGLAAGKGVIICQTEQEALEALDLIITCKAFGDAGKRVVIEEFLTGQEASVLAFSDGKNVKIMISSQDHKQVYDGDKGPNTGGMGAYAPTPVINDEIMKKVEDVVIRPTIEGMAKEGATFKGILYGGLMIDGDKMNVLEYNVRFGDPETQVVLPLMKSDIVPLFEACIDGTLDQYDIEWKDECCICIVQASGGYPGSYEKGKEITGLDTMPDDFQVFHAGTKMDGDKIVTNGGRVLGITTSAPSLKEAIDKVYSKIDKITFEGAYSRKDIGKRVL